MENRKPGRPRAEYPYLVKPAKHGRWWRVLVVTGRSGGRRQGYYKKAETLEGAIQWSREFRRQIAAAGRSIQDAVDAYLDHLRRKGNKDGSVSTAKYRLRALLDGELPLIDLSARRAQEMYDDLVDEGEVATDTHRGSLISGRAFGKFCVAKGWLRGNPFENVLPVGRKSRGKEQLRVDEARLYIRHCFAAWKRDKDRGAAASLLAITFAMRASEVSQLVARDVDDRGRVLRIAEHQAKTLASKRAMEVPPRLTPMLLDLAGAPATEAGHLFAKESGKPADRHWVLYHARRHMELAGVPIITAHGLRGTAATIGAVKTGGAAIMAEALGHENESMTTSTYIDAPTMANAASARVASLLDDDDSGTK